MGCRVLEVKLEANNTELLRVEMTPAQSKASGSPLLPWTLSNQFPAPCAPTSGTSPGTVEICFSD